MLGAVDETRHGHSGRGVGFGSVSFEFGSFRSKNLGFDRVISNSRFRIGSDHAGPGRVGS